VHRNDNNFCFFSDGPRVSQSPQNIRRKKEQNILRHAREKAKRVFVFSARRGNASLADMKKSGAISSTTNSARDLSANPGE
jgi:hypothetical protein